MAIAEKLHPLERKALPYLKSGMTHLKLIQVSGMLEVEVLRVIQWLSNKGIISTSESEVEQLQLAENGKKYQQSGLPEKRILQLLKVKSSTVPELFLSGMESTEVNVSIGILKSKAAISILPTKQIEITPAGLKLLERPMLEELFLSQTFPLDPSSLLPEQKYAMDNLLKRKEILVSKKERIITLSLTPAGKALTQDKNINQNVEEHLTHSMLTSGAWKGKKFRHYDIDASVPTMAGGKRHFVRQSIDSIRRIWLDMGFSEMEGDTVQSAFWDLDCLYVPQDHPARTMQDTFYIKDPAKAKLPTELVKKVKIVHETGGTTGSTGWGGKWSQDEASQNLLRTHTTVLSARTIAMLKKSNIPAKFFSINKVYRNEALNWKHLFELHQVEGIVVDPNANLSHLKGYLSAYYAKLGFKKIRMRPGHFPYTEPSLEIDVFNEDRQEWMELGGAGIFRPEVAITLLGMDIPILAWGQGLERSIMRYYQFKDIRDLYKNDLKEIRSTKVYYANSNSQ